MRSAGSSVSFPSVLHPSRVGNRIREGLRRCLLSLKLPTAAAPILALAAFSLFLVMRHVSSQNAPADPNLPMRPVVVELFTSEGCSSCPAADPLLAKMDLEHRVGNAEILPLHHHSHYSDHLPTRHTYHSAH